MRYIILLMAAVRLGPVGRGASAPSPNAIIQRSVEANNRDWAAAPQYEYLERDHVGKGTKTYRVRLIFGSPYQELLKVNGEPLPPDQRAQEERNLADAIAERRNETPGERASRIRAYREGRRRDHVMMNQLAEAFNFKLLRTRTVGSRRSTRHELRQMHVQLFRSLPQTAIGPPPHSFGLCRKRLCQGVAAA